MADPFSLTVRIADYAPVKAILEAADAVCDAEGDSPWTLTESIASLREKLEALSSDTDEGEGWEG